MTLDDMCNALNDLGRGRWVGPNLGVELSTGERLWEEPFDLPLEYRRADRWFWPEDLAVSVEVEWLALIEVGWLEPVGARLAQPVNLIGVYDGVPVTGIGGLVVWPGWTDPDVDVHRLGVPWVIGLPDREGRLLRWKCRSLSTALDLVDGVQVLDGDELADLVGLRIVEARVGAYVPPEPGEEPF